jgi:hypothetical protein
VLESVAFGKGTVGCFGLERRALVETTHGGNLKATKKFLIEKNKTANIGKKISYRKGMRLP